HRLQVPGTDHTLGDLARAAARGRSVDLPEHGMEPIHELFPQLARAGGRSRSGLKRTARAVVTRARKWGGDAQALADWGNDPPEWLATVDREREEKVAAWGALVDTGVRPELELRALLELAKSL
ncbi:MAG: hypothetical protein ABMA64_23995, partial [Myxococcota bacterium]